MINRIRRKQKLINIGLPYQDRDVDDEGVNNENNPSSDLSGQWAIPTGIHG